MKSFRFPIDTRISLMYALFGGVWILSSDTLLAALVADPAALTQIQTYKGWGFVLASALVIFLLLRRELKLRNATEGKINESEERYRMLFDLLPYGGEVLDTKGNILDCSPSTGKILGYERKEIVGRHIRDFLDTDSLKIFQGKFPELLKGEQQQAEIRLVRKDGSHLHVLRAAAPIFDREGKVDSILAVSVDISGRVGAEAKANQMKRLYATLSQVNQTIVRIKNRDDLFQSICDLSVKYGGFAFTWIGLLDETSGDILPVATHGADINDWPLPIFNIHKDEHQNLLTVTAIHTSLVVTSDDVMEDARTQILREQAQSPDFHSIAAVPFRSKSGIVGVLSLVSHETGLFRDEDEARLLEEMGLDISFALDTMEAEEEIQSLAKFPGENPNPVLRVARDGRLLYANHSSQPLLEYWQRKTGESLPEQECRLVTEAFASGVNQEVEVKCGEAVYWLIFSLVTGVDYLNIYGRDITERKQAEEKLRKSEESYRDLFEHMSEGYAYCQMLFDENGAAQDWIYILTNEAFEKQTGLRGVMGKRVSEVIPGLRQSDPVLFEIYSRVALTGQPEKIEMFVEALQMWFSVSVYSPKKEFFVAVFDVITERRQAEEALRISEQRYRSVVEDITELICRFTPDGTLTYVNDAYCRYYGKSLEELIGTSFIPAAAADFPQRLREHFKSFTPVNPISAIEQYDLLPNGEKRWREWMDRAIFDENGRLVEFQSTGRDITERKRAEEKLRESEARYRGIFNGVRDAIFVESLDGVILDVNEPACEMYGYRREEFIGKSVLEIVPSKESIISLSAGENETFGKIAETTNVRANGEHFPVELRGGSFEFGDKKLFLAVVHDITDRKRAEMERERLLDILESSVNEIYMFVPGTLRFEYVNSGAIRNLGYSFEQLKSMTPLDLKPEFTEASFRDKIAPLARHEKDRLVFQTVHRRADGSLYPVEVYLQLVEQAGQRVFLAIILDITERKQAEEKIHRQVDYLTALREIDQAITSTFDMRLSLGILISKTVSLLKVDAAAILLVNPSMGTLEYKAGLGFQTAALRNASVKLGEGYAGQAVLTQRMIHIPDLKNKPDQSLFPKPLKGEGFVSYHAMPLIAKGSVIAVLELFNRSAVARDREWLDFFGTLAGQAAIAVDSASLFEDLQSSNMELFQAYDATIEGWSRALDLRDKETEGHTRRVSEGTLNLARAMGFSEQDLAQIRYGALLHDIGKMGIPDSILLKEGPLTDEEWKIMRKHPGLARELLTPIRYLKGAALDIPYCHHEKWDGTGYPQGLKGEQIPLTARMFAVIDVFDALISDRPYRAAWSREEAIVHIQSLAGSHFDPQIVEGFLRMIQKA